MGRQLLRSAYSELDAVIVSGYLSSLSNFCEFLRFATMPTTSTSRPIAAFEVSPNPKCFCDCNYWSRITRYWVGDGVHAATAFPKLEFLIMEGMRNWEEWSLVGSETGNSSSHSLRVMPRLEVLCVIDCPKLRALPNGLPLRIFRTAMAHSLSVIEDFLFITELEIKMNDGMKRISNLPALKKLTIWDTPALKCVDNLVALQCLELQDYSMESLPEWLLRLVQQRAHLCDKNLQLVMRCSTAVIQRCLKGGPDWPIIECFSRVSAYTKDRSVYLEYTKQTGCYRANQ
uniref:Uncharacterized protein n=1 Tax=Ananas comosus var. bracteatus TaxID=296719 RepID=A0A6V7QKU7_ANACO|nr:unnamed protein product [Ananas comosus var. bracteatus]